MKLLAVTGNPILFSKSPEIFNSIFEQYNIEAKYTRLTAVSAEEAVGLFKELGMSGMSVTAPFKTDIMQYLDKTDQRAIDIGAVNTIVREDGLLVGYNTDYNGIIDTLGNVKDKKVLILGAGGAAKAVAYSIFKNGGLVNVYNRTEENAKNIALRFSVNYCKKQELKEAVVNSDIIINTIPSGIQIIENDWLHSNHTILDAIYLNSSYQTISNEKHIKFYSGETWLINQAKAAFNLFFKNENLDLSNFVLKKSQPKDKLIFTGFMGSGKSHIGKIISEKLACNLFSTDAIIETQEGLTINEIFNKHGEPIFRESEQNVLKMLSSMSGKAIVSSGGGVVLDQKNREIIRENFISIWLYASPKVIMQRTNPEERPLLKGNFNIEHVTKLMQERKPLYSLSSDIIINTSNKNIEELVEIVLNELSTIN